MKIYTLDNLFHRELRDLYSSENQLLGALPRMARAVANRELERALIDHLRETVIHVERLRAIGRELGLRLNRRVSQGMKGLIQEAVDLTRSEADQSAIDAGLIRCAQRMEHHEIAAYGTARVLALSLGHKMVANLLLETLAEQRAADTRLGELAKTILQDSGRDGRQAPPSPALPVTARAPLRSTILLPRHPVGGTLSLVG